MTFDARGGSGSGGGNNLVFGMIAVAVVGVAFAGTFMLSGTNSSSTAEAAATPRAVEVANVNTAPATISFKSKEADAYMAALAAVDSDAHAKLVRKLQRNSSKSKSEKFDVIANHAGDTIKANSAYLERADVRHVDRLLTHTRSSLKQASRANSKWCKGASYAGLQNASPAKMNAMPAEILKDEEALQTYAFEVMTLMLEAAADGRDNPVSHGKLTSKDELAVQGVVISMASDPQIMPLILASQGGQSPDDLMARLDVCELGATFVSAVKTLPQDTKGRLWAEMIREAELGGGDISEIGRIAGY